MTCAAAFRRSGRSAESCGIRTPARIASTAMVSRTSISVRAGRALRQTGVRCGGSSAATALGRSMQSRLFDSSTGIRDLRRSAAEQVVLLLQQLLDFAQLANLLIKLFDLIGIGRLTR